MCSSPGLVVVWCLLSLRQAVRGPLPRRWAIRRDCEMKWKHFSSILKTDIYSGYLPFAVPLLSDLVLIMTVILKLSTTGHAHSLGDLKYFDSTKLVGSAIGKVVQAGLPSNLSAANVAWWFLHTWAVPQEILRNGHFSRGFQGCSTEVATLQELIQGSFSNSLVGTEKLYWFYIFEYKGNCGLAPCA